MKSLVLFGLLTFAIVSINGQQNVKESFSNITSLKVEGIFCDVLIDKSGNDLVHFSGKIFTNTENDKIKILYRQNGSELKVWIDLPQNFKGSNKGELIFKVPLSTNVEVNNISGNVEADNISGSKLLMKSISGNIKVSYIQSDLKGESVSGNCLARNIDGTLTISSVSGNVQVEQIKGTLKASSISGNVEALSIEGDSEISSVSGHVKLDSANNNATASSTSGNVYMSNITGDVICSNISGSITLNELKGSISAKNLSGVIKGTNITFLGESYFKSMSGNVDISSKNRQEELSFQLKSFSGRLNAKGITGKETLQINKGSIIIHGETFSGEQSYL